MFPKTERDVSYTSRRCHLFRDITLFLLDPRKPPGVKGEGIVIIACISVCGALRGIYNSPLWDEGTVLEREVLECQSAHANYIFLFVRTEGCLFILYERTYVS